MRIKLFVAVLGLNLAIVISSCSQSEEVIEFDCGDIISKDCGDSPIIDICFTCEVCPEIEALSEASLVRVLLENNKERTSLPIGYFDLDENYNFKGSVCGTLLDGVEEQVIGFELMTVDSAGLEYVSFDKVSLSEGSTTFIDKTVLEFGPNCNGSVDVIFSKDPETITTEDVNFTICIIGSIGDCLEGSYYTSDIEWIGIEEVARDFLIETIMSNRNSTPCEGVYIYIRE